MAAHNGWPQIQTEPARRDMAQELWLKNYGSRNMSQEIMPTLMTGRNHRNQCAPHAFQTGGGIGGLGSPGI
jgi:hypothetical protein